MVINYSLIFLSVFKLFQAVDWRTSRRLLREKRGAGDPTGEAEEAPVPPAESGDLCANQQRLVNDSKANKGANSNEQKINLLFMYWKLLQKPNG